MLAYLSCSTHGVAISNRRLVAFDERGVTLRYKVTLTDRGNLWFNDDTLLLLDRSRQAIRAVVIDYGDGALGAGLTPIMALASSPSGTVMIVPRSAL